MPLPEPGRPDQHGVLGAGVHALDSPWRTVSLNAAPTTMVRMLQREGTAWDEVPARAKVRELPLSVSHPVHTIRVHWTHGVSDASKFISVQLNGSSWPENNHRVSSRLILESRSTNASTSTSALYAAVTRSRPCTSHGCIQRLACHRGYRRRTVLTIHAVTASVLIETVLQILNAESTIPLSHALLKVPWRGVCMDHVPNKRRLPALSASAFRHCCTIHSALCRAGAGCPLEILPRQGRRKCVSHRGVH